MSYFKHHQILIRFDGHVVRLRQRKEVRFSRLVQISHHPTKHPPTHPTPKTKHSTNLILALTISSHQINSLITGWQVMYDAEEVSRLPALLSQEMLVSRVSSIWMTVTLPGGALLWWDFQSSYFDVLFKVGRAESSPCGLASTLSWLRRWPLWHFHCGSGLSGNYKLWRWWWIELICFAFPGRWL